MLGKGHSVAPSHPDEQCHGKSVEAHEGRVDGPFGLDESWNLSQTVYIGAFKDSLTSIDDDETWKTL
jgi:hypothetical protein